MQQGPNIYQIKFEPDLPEDVLIAADVDGMEQRICGEDIYPYWEYIYENEGGFVETDGRYILCVLHTAGMQGGVVMFWDTAEEELVHVSDGGVLRRGSAVRGRGVHASARRAFYDRAAFCGLESAVRHDGLRFRGDRPGGVGYSGGHGNLLGADG